LSGEVERLLKRQHGFFYPSTRAALSQI